MNADSYVNSIVKRIKCSSNKKKDIKQQLLADINVRIDNGEKFDDVIADMGSIKEIADSFNENISDIEKKRYSKNKLLKIVITCIAILVLLILLIYWILPKGVDISKSEYFVADEVENAMKTTVELIDADDYDVLKENAILQMQSILDNGTMGDAKKQISDNWGKRIEFGTVYMVEMVQLGRHYAVGEITVSYENVIVTYRLTYDESMKLAGVYMR